MSSFWITPFDAEAKDRLRQVKAKVPRRVTQTRAPTPAELRTVVESLPGFEVEYLPQKPRAGKRWQVYLRTKKNLKTEPFVLISESQYPEEGKGIPAVFIEEGTPEVVVAIAVGLSKVCGTLLLDGEDSYGPRLISPDSKPEVLFEAMTAFCDEQMDDVPEEWR